MARGAELRWGVAMQGNGSRRRGKARQWRKAKFLFKWQRNEARWGGEAGRCEERQRREAPS